MRFSEAFSITVTPDDDWFDPHLTVDTRLFIDPLMLLEDGGQWADAHGELLDHFVHCYRLVAKAVSSESVSAVAARRLLTFPEPGEFGLGYCAESTAGAGSGAGFAQRMADGIAVAIRAGLTEPSHIEEIGILNEGIGADRISDAVANVLKSRFIAYTQAVARRHGVQLDEHRVRNSRCNIDSTRWVTATVELPTNPATGKPVILVPARFLNALPTLNAHDWFDSHFNADIRGELNIEVGQHIPKIEIVGYARQHPDRVRRWADEQTSRPDLHGYDFGGDPEGVVQWDREPVTYALQHPIPAARVSTQDELSALVGSITEQYRHFIEDQRGWALLWNDDGKEKPESAAQLVFLGMAQHYLRMFDVEVDREVELGRGPVDFKASSGASVKALVEIKKLHNGKFWNGLEAQLPIYLKSDGCEEGWYVALQYRSNKTSTDRIKELPARVRGVELRVGKTLRYAAVDARRKMSASKV
ncbi:hypothetical protein ND991_11250 [Gordonia sputi]|uniref:hypothetical protein n=1 Tax=Gordonia sputi TaxID=36823 RepID=UPI0020442DF5|nr:hypothetical protein [Gordonia sputi]MCM3895786.1 hypothetical protein [Gordonia sputi]